MKPITLHAIRPLFALILLAAFVSGLWWSPAHAGTRFDAIKKRGSINCGVVPNTAGFAMADSHGKQKGLDIDYCQAMAAAIFGNKNKVNLVLLQPAFRATALKSGRVDILAAEVTDFLQREVELGFNFTWPLYYDEAAVMTRKSFGIKSLKGLNGATMCVLSGSDSQANLESHISHSKIRIKFLSLKDVTLIANALESKRCDAFTVDKSFLASTRETKLKNPKEWVILPKAINQIPLSPAVLKGDDELYAVARWVRNYLILGSQYGITSKNVDRLRRHSNSPIVKMLLGKTGRAGKLLKLRKDFGYQIFKQVGNYDEIYRRGPGTILKIKQGPNRVYTKGGLQYAPLPIG